MGNEIRLTRNRRLAISIALLIAVPTISYWLGEATKNPMLIIQAALLGAIIIVLGLFLTLWFVVGKTILLIKKRRNKELDYWSTRKPRKRPSP
jgi:hypothetical protein